MQRLLRPIDGSLTDQDLTHGVRADPTQGVLDSTGLTQKATTHGSLYCGGTAVSLGSGSGAAVPQVSGA